MGDTAEVDPTQEDKFYSIKIVASGIIACVVLSISLLAVFLLPNLVVYREVSIALLATFIGVAATVTLDEGIVRPRERRERALEKLEDRRMRERERTEAREEYEASVEQNKRLGEQITYLKKEAAQLVSAGQDASNALNHNSYALAQDIWLLAFGRGSLHEKQYEQMLENEILDILDVLQFMDLKSAIVEEVKDPSCIYSPKGTSRLPNLIELKYGTDALAFYNLATELGVLLSIAGVRAVWDAYYAKFLEYLNRDLKIIEQRSRVPTCVKDELEKIFGDSGNGGDATIVLLLVLLDSYLYHLSTDISKKIEDFFQGSPHLLSREDFTAKTWDLIDGVPAKRWWPNVETRGSIQKPDGSTEETLIVYNNRLGKGGLIDILTPAKSIDGQAAKVGEDPSKEQMDGEPSATGVRDGGNQSFREGPTQSATSPDNDHKLSPEMALSLHVGIIEVQCRHLGPEQRPEHE